MPPAIMKHISSMNPKPANRNEFFTAADNQFLAVRITMSLIGNLKEKVSHFKERKTTKFNNVQTTESSNTFTCYFCKQPGHYKRNCPKFKGQQNFNRVIKNHGTPEVVQRTTTPNTTWEKDNDLENQFQWSQYQK
ncbi:1047_t:CDS:2 [Gigaspora margarita]|uniref:1047_t:CDS:1 n=1 Tax=Gigaspora margarita TaxID=4874 RepID=A0ABN7WHT5_GIGMA|nr:1047_t:CDS:2 [Gigaspora margarita]